MYDDFMEDFYSQINPVKKSRTLRKDYISFMLTFSNDSTFVLK